MDLPLLFKRPILVGISWGIIGAFLLIASLRVTSSGPVSMLPFPVVLFVSTLTIVLLDKSKIEFNKLFFVCLVTFTVMALLFYIDIAFFITPNSAVSLGGHLWRLGAIIVIGVISSLLISLIIVMHFKVLYNKANSIRNDKYQYLYFILVSVIFSLIVYSLTEYGGGHIMKLLLSSIGYAILFVCFLNNSKSFSQKVIATLLLLFPLVVLEFLLVLNSHAEVKIVFLKFSGAWWGLLGGLIIFFSSPNWVKIFLSVVFLLTTLWIAFSGFLL